MKKSKWFDGKKFNPFHSGTYETENTYIPAKTFQHWNGKFWGSFAPSAKQAENYGHFKSDYQSPSWRGIKK